MKPPSDCFRGLRIRAKVRLWLAVIFTWSFVLCCVVGSIIVFVRTELHTAYASAVPEAADAEIVSAELASIPPALENAVFLSDPTGADKQMIVAEKSLTSAQVRLKRIAALDPSCTEECRRLITYCKQTEKLCTDIEKSLSSTCESERCNAVKLWGAWRPSQLAIEEDVKTIHDMPYRKSSQRLSDCEMRIAQASSLFGFLSLLFALSFMILARAFTRAIVSPVRTLAQATEAVAAGTPVRESAALAEQRDEFGELYRSFIAMDKIISKRSAELSAAMAELKESNGALQQMAYVAAHDLQEPLRTITNYLQLLEKKMAANMDERSAKYMKGALDGSERLKKLISALLLFARVDSKGKEPELSDCNKLAHDVVASLSVRIEETGAQVSVHELPEMTVDPTQFGQLLQNLLQNAIKFGGKNISILCNQAGRENVICVADDGVGFDMKFADRIFGIFQRVHGDEYAGTGIGLAVCKKIVHRHGGRIWVESKLGHGTKFYFSIPRQPFTLGV